jgi:hypothetical protein
VIELLTLRTDADLSPSPTACQRCVPSRGCRNGAMMHWTDIVGFPLDIYTHPTDVVFLIIYPEKIMICGVRSGSDA